MSSNKEHIKLRSEIVAWATDLPIHRNQRDILVALASFSNLSGFCDPCYETIAKLSGMSVRSVKRWMPTLKAERLIAWKRRYKSHERGSDKLFNERDSNVYRIYFPFTQAHLELQRSGIDKSELGWNSGRRLNSAHPKCQNGTGKDNQKQKLVIPDSRPPVSKSLLASYRQSHSGDLFVQLDFYREHGLLEIEVAGHNALSDKVVRRKCYWLAAQRVQIGKWFASAGHAGLGCFIRPAGPRHRLLLIDDLDSAGLARAAGLGMPGLVIETSLGNYQVWLVSKHDLNEKQRHIEQQRLIVELGGDPGASSGKQFGRAAGTVNTKQGRNAFLTRSSALIAVSGYVPSPAMRSVDSIRTSQVIQSKKSILPAVASTPDHSAAEFRLAIEAIKNGINESGIVDELAERRLLRKPIKGAADALRYANKTLSSARAVLAGELDRSMAN